MTAATVTTQHPESTTATEGIGLVLLVAGACCPFGWHGMGLGLLGLATLAGRSIWRQFRERRFAALPWVLAMFLAWTGLSLLAVPRSQVPEALREWLQWDLLLVGGWYAGKGLTKGGWRRFETVLVAGLLVSLVIGLVQSLRLFSLSPDALARLSAALHGAPYANGGNGPDPAEELILGLQRSHLQYCSFVCFSLPFVLTWLRRAWVRLLVLAVALWTVLPAPFLLLATGVGLWFVPLRSDGGSRFRAWLLRALVLLGIAVVVSFRPGPSPLEWVYPSLRSSEGAQPKRLLVEHRAAIMAATRHPLGYGPGTYRDSVRRARIEADLPKPVQDRVRRDGNGQYLVTLVETGATGLVLLFAYLLSTVWRNRADDELVAGLLILVGTGFSTGLLVRGMGSLACFLLGRGWAEQRGGGGRRLLTQALLVAAFFGVGLLWPRRVVSEDATLAGLPATDQSIWAEAEAAERVHPSWRIEPGVQVGDHRVLRIPLGTGKRVGEARYRLASPAAGRWKLWLRVRWAGGCANSILASVDGTPPVSVEDAIFERWHWVDVHPNHTFILPKGEFELVLANSEDDVAIDQIAFLPDPRDVPVGILQNISPEPPLAPASSQEWDFDAQPEPRDQPFDKYAD